MVEIEQDAGLPVWIRSVPEDRRVLEDAVTRGGGVVVPELGEARAVVWTVGSADAARLGADNIEFVQLGSAGIEDWVASGMLDERRVWASARGVYSLPVAEYAVSAIFTAARRTVEYAAATQWHPLEVSLVSGSTVGIVGAGEIGHEIIRLLEPLAVRVLAVTRSGRHVPGAAASYALDELDGVLAECDYVVIAAPLTPETRGLFSAARLRAMRAGSWLINLARGGLVDTDALLAVIREGRGGAPFRKGISGAILDVTDPEPLPDDHPIWHERNILVTAHTANYWRLGLPLLAKRVEINVRKFLDGDQPLGVIDVTSGY